MNEAIDTYQLSIDLLWNKMENGNNIQTTFYIMAIAASQFFFFKYCSLVYILYQFSTDRGNNYNCYNY